MVRGDDSGQRGRPWVSPHLSPLPRQLGLCLETPELIIVPGTGEAPALPGRTGSHVCKEVTHPPRHLRICSLHREKGLEDVCMQAWPERARM